jgi:hypothetical protein
MTLGFLVLGHGHCPEGSFSFLRGKKKFLEMEEYI